MPWPTKRLGDLCRTTSGGTPSRLKPEYFGGTISWVKSGDLNDGEIVDCDESITDQGLRFSNAKLFDSGTLLIAMYGATVGKLGILGIPAATNQAVCAISPPPELDRKFLFYFLLSIREKLIEKSTGGAQPNISQTIIRDLEIPLPPLAEQQRIVDILDRAAAIQRLRRAAEEKAREIIPALFVDMFGDPATNPKGWRPGYLPDVLIGGFRNGLYLPKDAYARRDGGSGVEMVHMSDLFKGMVERGSLKRVIATEKQLADWSVCPDDLLLARRSLNFDGAARTTRISKSDEPLLFESSIIRLRPNRHVVNSEFLHYYFTDVSFRRSYVIPRITGATIYGINQKALSEMPVFIPPLQLQERFAAICKLLYDMSGLGTQASGVSERLLASAQTNLVGADD